MAYNKTLRCEENSYKPLQRRKTMNEEERKREREKSKKCHGLTDHTKNKFSSPLRLLFHELFDGYELQRDPF